MYKDAQFGILGEKGGERGTGWESLREEKMKKRESERVGESERYRGVSLPWYLLPKFISFPLSI